jgi:hypothetical protein
MPRERDGLRAPLRVGDGVPVLVLLPVQDEGSVRPGRRGLPRFPRPFLLRVLRAVPGVPGAQEPRLRLGDRLGCQCGQAEARRHRSVGDGSSWRPGRHDEVDEDGEREMVRFCVLVLQYVLCGFHLEITAYFMYRILLFSLICWVSCNI